MSLIELFKNKKKFTLFTTPTHGQKLFLTHRFSQFYKYDISENEAFDSETALDSAQNKAAKIFGTKQTLFLTNGSTSGIIASVLACCKKGDNVLLWKNAHPSHKNAVELANANPIFYETKTLDDWGISASVDINIIEKEFQKNPIKAIIITSPTYEGIVSDIKKIKKLCEKHKTYLIVDEAHGALYPFCEKLPKSAIELQADYVIQSLHKTAGGLNPTALLHCNCENNPQDALKKISTTSPSYPLLTSIEKNINYLNSKKGRKDIITVLENIIKLKQNTKNILYLENDDPTKIVLKSEKMDGLSLSKLLFDNKIEDERANNQSILLLCGIGTDEKKLKRLEKILKKFF